MPHARRAFVFDLQPVLDQRERVEQEHQRRVALIERERIALEDRLRGLQQRIIGARDDLRCRLAVPQHPPDRPAGAPPPAIAIDAARRSASLAMTLVAQAERTVLELAGVHRRLEAARRELAAASAARKAVDLLRTRRWESWKRDLARAEAAEIDELAVMRHARRSDGP